MKHSPQDRGEKIQDDKLHGTSLTAKTKAKKHTAANKKKPKQQQIEHTPGLYYKSAAYIKHSLVWINHLHFLSVDGLDVKSSIMAFLAIWVTYVM